MGIEWSSTTITYPVHYTQVVYNPIPIKPFHMAYVSPMVGPEGKPGLVDYPSNSEGGKNIS